MVQDELRSDPRFEGRLEEDFSAIAGTVIAYVARRIDHPGWWMEEAAFIDEDMDTIKESHLADDFEEWIAANLDRGTVGTEVRRHAAGRVDVAVGFGGWKVVIELKRESSDSSRSALEDSYSAQATSYGSTDYPFGMVLVVDLSEIQSGPPRHLTDSIWVSQNMDQHDQPRWLMWAVVQGRRVSPSSLSK